MKYYGCAKLFKPGTNVNEKVICAGGLLDDAL
jgi:hypothetical protein